MVSLNEVDVNHETGAESGWAHWEDPSSQDSSTMMIDDKTLNDQPLFVLETSLPPQLHPAVSLGMRRMSSCYFSIGSNDASEASNSIADLVSLWDDSAERKTEPTSGCDKHKSFDAAKPSPSGIQAEISSPAGSVKPQYNAGSVSADRWTAPSDLLYHDILMNVFTFLDAKSLAAFSETARRPNFECFYFLQLQLHRALLGGDDLTTSNCQSSQDPLSAIAGVGAVSRLAALDRAQAEETVQEFLDSNSTLRTMPLSHSLAYVRQLLRRSGFRDTSPSRSPSQQAIASAALLITILGAASSIHELSSSFGTELPNVLFRIGCVGGLMGAARTMSDVDSMRERAETLARTLQDMPHQLLRQVRGHDEGAFLSRMVHGAYCAAYGNSPAERESLTTMSSSRNHAAHENPNLYNQLLSPDPYDHLQLSHDTKEDTKKPSGCVGAYSRAVAHASECVTAILKERRRQKFLSLPKEEQRRLSSAFIDACTSDENLDIVQDMVQVRETIDVDLMCVGSDGTETCALHTSAFHGSCKILEYLCGRIDESNPSYDGGLCDVNRKDDNGWTGMHFAAGANSVQAVRILSSHGAELSIEAVNGYTPLQWAIRLQNKEVAEELQRRTSEREEGGWMSRKPLSMIASRFFALIPSH